MIMILAFNISGYIAAGTLNFNQAQKILDLCQRGKSINDMLTDIQDH